MTPHCTDARPNTYEQALILPMRPPLPMYSDPIELENI